MEKTGVQWQAGHQRRRRPGGGLMLWKPEAGSCLCRGDGLNWIREENVCWIVLLKAAVSSRNSLAMKERRRGPWMDNSDSFSFLCFGLQIECMQVFKNRAIT